jgi:hypothetical protein
MLLDELKLHQADAGDPVADALVFATNNGTARHHRFNITQRVLTPAIERANVELRSDMGKRMDALVRGADRAHTGTSGRCVDRTRDLLLVRQALSQLS